MELTTEQKQKVREWITGGASIADVQKRLQSEFQVALTYMDTRFLIDDLNLSLVDKTPPKKSEAAPGSGESGGEAPIDGQAEVADDDPYADAAEPVADETFGPSAAGGVKVDVDRLTRPGTVVSGTVSFSDGNSGKWALDQMGRLVFEASKPDYRPSQADLQAFQTELSLQLQKHGF